jgi:G3E family GTPase
VGLVETLGAVRDAYDPDWVIIEPTGLAAPGDILGLVVDHVEDLDVIRVLTIVDAERWPMLLEVVEPLITSQLASADVVAVNKTDTVAAGELETVMAGVRELAGDVLILPLSAGGTGAGMKSLLRAVP